MSWFDWLSDLFGPTSRKVTTLGDRVSAAEERADAAEAEKKLLERLTKANQRIKAAKGPVSRRFAMWVAIVILVLFVFLFFRTCV